MLVIKQLVVPIDFHCFSLTIMEVIGDQQLFDYFKILSFVLHKIETYTGLERVNDDNIFFFGWTVPLRLFLFICSECV